MKQLKKMIQCLNALLKKKFFKLEKTDISHNCKKAFLFDLDSGNLNSKDEEYLVNYKSTTRWQTV